MPTSQMSPNKAGLKTSAIAFLLGVLGGALWACGGDEVGPVAYFETDPAAYQTDETFWNAPFPAAWRMTATGAPNIAGYPLGGSDAMENLTQNVGALRGVTVMPNVYFRMGAPPAAAAFSDVGVISSPMVAATDPVVFINVDPQSPDQGRIVPSVAAVLMPDKYSPDFLLAVAPAPGIVLLGNTTYAVAVRRAIGGVSAAASFVHPPPAIAEALAPLWPALATHEIERDDIVIATVFTTGDAVAALAAQSQAVRAAYDAEILTLTVDTDGAKHDAVCELVGTIRMPQFQLGTPPFDSEGEISLGDDGMPVATGTQDVPFVLTLPKQVMPKTGWPLHQFLHGSGSRSSIVIDGGRSATAQSDPEVGKGPGYVVALHGMAAVGAAMPLNPERLAGASDYEYLNIINLSAMPHVFAQGVFEQGLLLDAIIALQIDPATVAACAGVALPAGATAHLFNPAHVTAGGQSMGGVYTNMFGAIDERVRAIVPTGAGGLWHKMALESREIPGGRDLLAGIVRTHAEALSLFHPAMNMLAMSWHSAEPMAYMARVAFDPLPNMPVRHIFEPVGENDSFFSTDIYNAAALAFSNHLAGTPVWSSMTDSLALAGLGGVLPLPVSGNRTSRTGATYTGVVVQYPPDGILDAHYIWRQREELKAQYGAFLAAATEPAPTLIAPP